MAQNEGAEEKNLPPTARQLAKLRKEGQVARSTDLISAVSLVVASAYVAFSIGAVSVQIRRVLAASLEGGGSFETRLPGVVKAVAETMLVVLGPLFALLIVAILLASIVDAQGLALSKTAVSLNFGKLNPVTGLKQIFSLRSLIELGKGLVKIAVLAALFTYIGRHFLNDVFWAPVCGRDCTWTVFRTTLGLAVIAGSAVVLVGGLIDVPIARWMFKRDNKMSVSQVKREAREDQGDPDVNRARKAMRDTVLGGVSMRGIDKATILLVAEDAAIGLAYTRGRTPAPIVVAKGGPGDHDAMRVFAQGRIPITRQPALTTRLMQDARVGDVIPQALFNEVAAVLVAAGLLT